MSLLSLVMASAVVASPVPSADAMSFELKATWDDGHLAHVEYQHDLGDVDHWYVEFTYPYDIDFVEQGKILGREGDRYKVLAHAWTGAIEAGEPLKLTIKAKHPYADVGVTDLEVKDLNNDEYMKCDIHYQELKQWQGGFVGQYEIVNNGNTPIYADTLTFDAPFTLTSSWNARLEETKQFQQGQRYQLKIGTWQSVVEPGESIRVGIQGTVGNSGSFATQSSENFSSANSSSVKPSSATPFAAKLNGQKCRPPIHLAYHPSYSVELGYVTSQIPAEEITHLLHAFGSINSHGKIELNHKFNDTEREIDGLTGGHFAHYQKLKQRNPDLQILLSLGGETANGDRGFERAVSSDQAIDTFVKGAADFLRQYPLDGIDIDWEYPDTSELSVGYIKLLKALRDELDELGFEKGRYYELGTAVAAGPDKIDYFQPDVMGQYVDFVNVMTYLYYGAWEPFTYHTSPLYVAKNRGIPEPWDEVLTVNWTLQNYIEKGTPNHKLVVGIPLVGVSWNNVPATNDGLANYQGDISVLEGFTTYFQGVELMEQGYVEYWDDVTKNTYLYSPHHLNGHFIQFEGKRAVKEKVDYAKKYGLGGIFYWEVSMDAMGEDSMLNYVAEQLK